VQVRPVSPAALISELAERIAAVPLSPSPQASWVRVAVDGAPAAEPDRWAADLVAPLQVLGRPVLHVRAGDFLRPASLRLEFGRNNADAFYEGWLDLAGLRRELLDPLASGGTGRVLPALWDAATDRASRAGYVELPPGAVVLVSGGLLLGAGLPFELTVHLEMSAAALARRTPPADAWTLPAFARYADEVGPATFADAVVRLNDPAHPAVVEGH
jgi:hypothetical protein